MDLKREYTELLAGAKIEFHGSTYNLSGLGPFHNHKDRSVRKESYGVKFKWYEENGEAFDDLYDQLVKLRHRMATTLGYGNFIELAYFAWGVRITVPKKSRDTAVKLSKAWFRSFTNYLNRRKESLVWITCTFTT